MKIGVVGGGTVGHATARCFMEHGEVRVYDTVPERRTHSLTEVTSCDLVFVCLPTPPIKERQKLADEIMTEPGEAVLPCDFSRPAGTTAGCDLSYIEDFFEWHRGFKANFVLRSTVPIGTTRRLAEKYDLPNLVHSPEFLTARCAVTDAQIPARNIIGYSSDWQASKTGHPIESLYYSRFPGVPCLAMSSDESEAVKLFQNGFFAVKVAYFNEINSLATKLGLNWEVVVSAILADGRIAHSHTKVPGPDGNYGFGGACLPKDLDNLRGCFRDAGVVETICSAARLRNEHYDVERNK